MPDSRNEQSSPQDALWREKTDSSRQATGEWGMTGGFSMRKKRHIEKLRFGGNTSKVKYGSEEKAEAC